MSAVNGEQRLPGPGLHLTAQFWLLYEKDGGGISGVLMRYEATRLTKAIRPV